MELEKTAYSEWIQMRADAVRAKISAYDVMQENGVNEIPDPYTAVQIACRWHGPDRRPSARYYPAGGKKHDSVRCFKCNITWDSISLYGQFRGLKFMDALSDLEKRYHVKIPRRPEFKVFEMPSERGSDYTSGTWEDVGPLLKLCEKKLARVKDKCGFEDYVKLCRVIDAVTWDFEYNGKGDDGMVKALTKARFMMDAIYSMPDPSIFMETEA